MKNFRQARIWALFGALALLLGSCSQEPDPGAIPAEINRLIDPEIQGRDRQVIAEVMATLPPEERERVIYQDADGNVYVNRARDLHYKEPEVWTKIGENDLVNQKGERLRIPPWPGATRPGQPRQEPGCAAGQGTGASFRIHSQPGEIPAISPVYRFAFASAYVRLPKWQEEFSYNPAKEGVYYMLGGWGNPDLSANHKGHRQAVDAGIFFNTGANNLGYVYQRRGDAQQ